MPRDPSARELEARNAVAQNGDGEAPFLSRAAVVAAAAAVSSPLQRPAWIFVSTRETV